MEELVNKSDAKLRAVEGAENLKGAPEKLPPNSESSLYV